MKKNFLCLRFGQITYILLLAAILFSGCTSENKKAGEDNHAGHNHSESDKTSESSNIATTKPVKAETNTDKVVPYTMTTCVVSGGKLGSMGDPVRRVHEGKEIKFCCDGCIDSFKEDPKKYMKKIH